MGYCPSLSIILIGGINSLPKEEKEYATTGVLKVFKDLNKKNPDIIFEVIS